VVLTCSLFALPGNAQTLHNTGCFSNGTTFSLDWSTVGWTPAGSTTFSATNVDGATTATSYDIDFTVSGLTGTLTTENSVSTPGVTNSLSDGVDGLHISSTGLGDEEEIVLRMEFTPALAGRISFDLYNVIAQTTSGVDTGQNLKVYAQTSTGFVLVPELVDNGSPSWDLDGPGIANGNSPSTTANNDQIGVNIQSLDDITDVYVVLARCSSCDSTGDTEFAIGDIDFCLIPDTDQDGVDDFADEDTDNDGIYDNVEQCPSPSVYTFDWNNYTWGGGSSEQFTMPDGTVMTASAVSNGAVAVSIDINSNLLGGFGAGTESWFLNANQLVQSQSIDVVMDFSEGIDSLSFTLFDVDEQSGQYTDSVIVIGFYAGFVVFPTLTGATNTSISDNSALGTAVSADAGNLSNVLVQFNNPVDSVSIFYTNGEDAPASPGNQWISIYDLTYKGDCGPVDTDGDGIEDYLDIDADNDGIVDYIEFQASTSTPIGPSGSDSDNDGIDNNFETVGDPVDTDGDGVPDFRDPDADDDGDLDLLEGWDTDNDGTANTTPSGSDSDGDGLDDAFDDVDGWNAVTNITNNGQDSDDFPNLDDTGTSERDWREQDSDEDGISDFDDIDDDNDGIPDVSEADGNDPAGDEDGDGIPNFADTSDGGDSGDGSTTDYTDNDGDGTPDVFDTDNDGIPNHLDIDADNDGIVDLIESGIPDATITTLDANSDGIIDDSNDFGTNGLANTLETVANNGVITYTIRNSDGGDYDNFLDIDSDDDGIVDYIEAQATTASPLAPSGADSDNDGLDNNFETGGLSPVDTDADGTPDYYDTDSDDDGDLDSTEGWDTDNDGTPNTTAAGSDSDGDGLDDNYDNVVGPNATTNVTNNGQTSNSFPNLDESGTSERDWREALPDCDGDGVTDPFDLDDDNDGIPDSAEGSGDFDNDGYDNQCDLDSDGDGISDLTESGVGTDANNDGIVDGSTDADGDGVLSSADSDDSSSGTTYTEGDNDEDGHPDFLDIDSDNDGITDNVEAMTTAGYSSPSGSDTDMDGLDNSYDPDNSGSFITPTDTDGDSTPDYLDQDSDNDAIADEIEGHDSDGDGVADASSPSSTGVSGGTTDADNDGLYDGWDNNASDPDATNGSLLPTSHPDILNSGGDRDWREANDMDQDGIVDIYDIDKDDDGIMDSVERACNAPSTLDWDAHYATGASPASATPSPATTFNGVTLTFSDNDPSSILASSTTNFLNSILGWRILKQKSPVDAQTTHTVHFDAPVYDLSFSLIDVDFLDGDFKDQVVVNAFYGGVAYPINDNDYTLGSVVEYLGNNRFSGTASTSSTQGNVDLVFPGPVDSVQIKYSNNESSAFPSSNQFLLIGDFTFSVCNATDSDSDGFLDEVDIDADNDGITDNTEAQSTSGYIAPSGSDTDMDGLDNAYDNDNSGTLILPVDTDGDGTGDYLDTDADNDGYADVLEGHDSDGSGDADSGSPANTGVAGGTTDADRDGLYDGWDNNTSSTDPTNGSLTPSSHPDADNPGTDRDWREARDTDGDGVLDPVDLDDDNDGIPDITEAGGNEPDGDEDGDGVLNHLDVSDDGNGGDGSTTDYTDSDADGVPDAYDFDGDGVPNHLDKDSDNDGIVDILEVGGTDTNEDGEVDYPTPGDATTMTDSDGDGLDDNRDDQDSGSGGGEVTSGTPWAMTNTDLAGNADYLDIDSDDDGIVDNAEAQSTAGYTAPSGSDTDGDGIDNSYDPDNAGTYVTPVNTESTGLADYRDTDSDDDGEADSVEGHDSDGNGSADSGSPANTGVSGGSTDADSDGLLDGFDNDTGDRDPTNGSLTGSSYPNVDAGESERDWREVPCDGGAVTLAPSNTTTTASDFCVNGDWTYYYAPADPTELLFAIEHKPTGGNTNDFTASVDITVSSNPTSEAGVFSSENAGAGQAAFVMGRYYNITVTSGSLNGNVNVRFYYDTDESDTLAAVADRWNQDNAGGTANVSGLRWFTMTSGTFDPGTADLQTTGIQGSSEQSPTATSTENSVDFVQFSLSDLTGGSLAYTVGNNSVILPVEWFSFEAKKQGDEVELIWVTASEKNSDVFIAERSTDGRNWTSVATVQAAGNSQVFVSYQVFDREPAEGENYYRIKQVDFDQSFEYSQVRTVVFESELTNSVIVYPNPNDGEFTAKLHDPDRIDRVSLLNSKGELIRVWSPAEFRTGKLSASDLSSGMYMLQVEKGQDAELVMVIVR